MVASAMRVVFGMGLQLARPKGRIAALLQTVMAQAGIMVANLATGVLTARVLGATGRGEFAAISLWLMFPSLLATAGLQTALVFEVGRDPARRLAATVAALALSTLVFVPLALLCLPTLIWLLRGYPAWVTTVSEWALALSVLNAWVVIARNSLIGARNYTRFNLFNMGFSVLYLVALIALALLHSLSPASAIWAQLMSTAVVSVLWIPTIFADWRANRRSSVRRILRPLAAYGVRAAPTDLLMTLSVHVDGLILVGIVAPREMGLYVAASAFARILLVIQTALSSVMLADLVGRPIAEIELFVHRGFRVLVLALLCCCGALLLLDHILLRLVVRAGLRKRRTGVPRAAAGCRADMRGHVISAGFPCA